jgi:hypothetical protein
MCQFAYFVGKGEFQTELKNYFKMLLWDLGVIDGEKTEGRKSHDTISLI